MMSSICAFYQSYPAMKSPIPTPFFLSILLLSGCSAGDQPPGHLSPEKALESFQVHPDFRVEIFAAEPHVIDPVELVFDEDGRAFRRRNARLSERPACGRLPAEPHPLARRL